MDPKAWYLGPLGDLRALHCPEPGVKRPIKRYGSIHQAISGARTVDITGYRASYELVIPWLEPREARFLQALHERTVPGPFFLIDPLEVNRLGRKSAYLDPTAVSASAGGLLRALADPPDAGVPVTVLEWSGMSAAQSMTLPRVVVLNQEDVTFSVFVSCAEVSTLTVDLNIVDKAGGDLGTVTTSVETSVSWQRIELPATMPVGAVAVVPKLTTTGGVILRLAAAQLEHGLVASEWHTGGAAPTVIIDQVDRESPNYPRNDFSVTLLEA